MGGIFVGILFPFLRCDFRFSSRSMPMGEGIGKLMALKPAISRDETGNRALYGMVLTPSAGVGPAASILHWCRVDAASPTFFHGRGVARPQQLTYTCRFISHFE